MNRFKNDGFTIVELMTALAVGLIIMSAIYAMVNLSQKSSAGIGRKVLTQQDARSVLDFMSMEVAMATYNPNLNVTWSGNMLGNCSSVNMQQTRTGIQSAGSNTIGIAMDIGGLIDGTGANVPSGKIGDAPNEYIIYSYDATNAAITRDVTCGGAQVILGSDSSTMVRNNLSGTPLFQYFNRTGTDISASVIATPDVAAGSGGIKDIRIIRINIVVDVVSGQGKQFQVSRRTYTTDVMLRNHALANH